MSRAYLRLDPAFDEKKDGYPDGAYRALIACFCLAEQQVERGHFRSERFLRALLGPRAKWVSYLLVHHDIAIEAGGRIYVVGWDEWQEGDWKVGERVKRIRARRNGPNRPAVTPDVTVGVTLSSAKADRLDLHSAGVIDGAGISAGAGAGRTSRSLLPGLPTHSREAEADSSAWFDEPGAVGDPGNEPTGAKR